MPFSNGTLTTKIEKYVKIQEDNMRKKRENHHSWIFDSNFGLENLSKNWLGTSSYPASTTWRSGAFYWPPFASKALSKMKKQINLNLKFKLKKWTNYVWFILLPSFLLPTHCALKTSKWTFHEIWGHVALQTPGPQRFEISDLNAHGSAGWGVSGCGSRPR